MRHNANVQPRILYVILRFWQKNRYNIVPTLFIIVPNHALFIKYISSYFLNRNTKNTFRRSSSVLILMYFSPANIAWSIYDGCSPRVRSPEPKNNPFQETSKHRPASTYRIALKTHRVLISSNRFADIKCTDTHWSNMRCSSMWTLSQKTHADALSHIREPSENRTRC